MATTPPKASQRSTRTVVSEDSSKSKATSKAMSSSSRAAKEKAKEAMATPPKAPQRTKGAIKVVSSPSHVTSPCRSPSKPRFVTHKTRKRSPSPSLVRLSLPQPPTALPAPLDYVYYSDPAGHTLVIAPVAHGQWWVRATGPSVKDPAGVKHIYEDQDASNGE